MNSRKKSIDNYTKYMFMTREEAEKARKTIEKLFPNIITSVSENGTLFCQTFGRHLHEQMQIMSEVQAHGGAKA
jgi:hypothetical protein